MKEGGVWVFRRFKRQPFTNVIITHRIYTHERMVEIMDAPSKLIAETDLEEDSDASLFLQAYEKHVGRSPIIKEAKQSNSRSRIRSYTAFRSPLYVNRKRAIELLTPHTAHRVREQVDTLDSSLSFYDAFKQIRQRMVKTDIPADLKRGLALEVSKRHTYNQAINRK